MSKLTQVFATATIAAIGFAAAPAFAQEATYEYPQAATSAVTRAQVQAELFQARADGSIRAWSTSYNPLALAKSLKSREVVRAELLASDRATVSAMTGEDSGSFALSRQPLRAAGTVLAAR
ncbi:MAG: DUF4148 domain-containing protein [Rubrivivax sp.]|jgi:hypothetical protein|nr:DUF4148 domain-containing protein [Rubrivivax sp.]